MRGRADGKGRSAGQDRSEETRGQRGWEREYLRSGAGSPESRDRGEGAASPGAGWPARPLGAEKARAKLRGDGNPFRSRGLYLSDGERGIKQS